MKVKIYISQEVEKNVGTRFQKVLKKSGYKVAFKTLDKTSTKITCVTALSSLEQIDATYNGLNTSDKYLLKFTKVVKRLYCLSKIDEKVTYKELRKYMPLLNKIFLYIQILSSKKNWKSKFDSIDKMLKFYMHDAEFMKISDALSELFSMSDLIALFQEFTDAISFKKESTSLKEEMESFLENNPQYESLRKAYIDRSYILLDQFLDTKLSDSKKKYFEDLLALSLSLNKEEKIRIIRMLPTLSIYQIDELIKVWIQESKNFKELEKIHYDDTVALKNKCDNDWKDISENLARYLLSSPRDIMSKMRDYIKGQDHIIKDISTILYYQQEIMYGNKSLKPLGPILVAGPTGCGKSFILQTSATLTKLPYIHVDCSSLVSEGIKGHGINDVLKDILRICDYDASRAEKAIVFFDEFDKLLLHHDGESIMTQILRVAEGHDTPIVTSMDQANEFKGIKSLNTSKILFVFGGSFEHIMEEKREKHSGFLKEKNTNTVLNLKDLETSGFPKELLGRIKGVFILRILQVNDYFEILKKGKNSPILEYKNLIKSTHGNRVTVDDDILKSISKMAFTSNYGARGLHQIIYKLFQNILFEAPETKQMYDITLENIHGLKQEIENKGEGEYDV